jgi:hypothetical protein
MKHGLKLIFALATTAVMVTTFVQADNEEKVVIALKTDHFELNETDISSLAIGEAKTIETESGKVIDLLRTAEGAEVYIDGELLEMNFDKGGLHEGHMIRKHVEVICEEGEDCDRHVVIHESVDGEIQEWIQEEGQSIIIHKEIELSCTDDDEGAGCSDNLVWMSDEEEHDIEELHREHADGNIHKVIVIKQKIDKEG